MREEYGDGQIFEEEPGKRALSAEMCAEWRGSTDE